MSTTQPPNESTFRAYTPADGELYSQHRPRYSTALYETLFTHHTSTGGKLGTVVDVGCGREYQSSSLRSGPIRKTNFREYLEAPEC